MKKKIRHKDKFNFSKSLAGKCTLLIDIILYRNFVFFFIKI